MNDSPRGFSDLRASGRAGLGVCAMFALGAGLLLAGCGASSLRSPFAAQSCVSWAEFETPQGAFDDATLVVSGTVAPAHGTRDVFGHRAAVHELRVAQVLKGEFDGGGTIEVAATPVTCTGDEIYPDGDPLDVDGDVVLFLTDVESAGKWRLLSPFHGVLARGDTGAPPSLDAW